MIWPPPKKYEGRPMSCGCLIVPATLAALVLGYGVVLLLAAKGVLR